MLEDPKVHKVQNSRSVKEYFEEITSQLGFTVKNINRDRLWWQTQMNTYHSICRALSEAEIDMAPSHH